MRGASEVLISSTPFGHQAAVVDGAGQAVALHVELADAVSAVGDVWRGRVTRKVPGHEAVFVQLDEDTQGMLPGTCEAGRDVIVQVVRDGFGGKGPRLTAALSFAGRYLVYRPDADADNVSREIKDKEGAERMRAALGELARPAGGFTARRFAVDATTADLEVEATALVARAGDVVGSNGGGEGPQCLMRAGGLVGRLLREGAPDGAALWFDDRETCETALAQARAIAPVLVPGVDLAGDTDLFERHDLHGQWDAALGAAVPLPSGGRLVIEETTACVAIDVDAGTGARRKAQEKAAREAIPVAAREIVRRNLAGLIAIDLPGDAGRRGAKELAAAMRRALIADRTPADVLGVSHGGVLEVTRRRIGPSLLGALTEADDSGLWTGRRWRLVALAHQVARRARMEWVAGARALAIRAEPALAGLLADGNPLAAWLRAEVAIEPVQALPRDRFEVRAG